MANDYLNSSDLIKSIKRRASVPENQSTFNTEDFLEFANEELHLSLVPSIMLLHEDYLLYEEDVDIVPGQSEYEIPSRAVGNKLRDVQYKISDDNLLEMTRIGIGERFNEYDVRSETNLKKYYVKNNKIVLTPPIAGESTGALAMIYYIKPSQLVEEDRIAVIQDIDLVTGKVVLSDIPDHFSSSEDFLYDFYKAGSPHNVMNIDIKAISIDAPSKSIFFAPEDLPTEWKKGDHLAQAGECSIPQIPSDLHPMLAQMVACRCLESMGDSDGLKNALIKLGQMQSSAATIIDNRIDDSPQKVVNRHGVVRTSIFSKRFNRR